MNIYKIKNSKQIFYPLGLAIFLNLLRIILFKDTHFLYILWNIFLAFIPFFISSFLLSRTSKDTILRPLFVAGFIVWFIFLPNAPYVITDFIHLGRIHSVPVMYDAFLLFASAWVSLFFGLTSLVQMKKMLTLKFPQKITDIIILITILFTSFGVYLGRYLRFNSWDLFISHNSIITSVWKIFAQSNNYANVYGYTALFFVFIYTAYKAFDLEK